MHIWIFQTGEFLHIDGEKVRSMRAMNLSEYFLKNGHSVTLLSSNFSHQTKKHRTHNLKIFQIRNKFKIILIPSLGYKSNISIKRLVDHLVLGINTFKYLIKVQNNNLPNFVFVGYPPIETSFFISIWLKAKRIPFCIDVKDQWPHIFLLKAKGNLRRLIKFILIPYFFAAKYSLNQADFLTSITPTFLKWAENFSKNKSSKNQTLYLVPNSKETSSKSLKNEFIWWEKKVGINIKEKNKIIFTGSFNNAYDFDDLIESLISTSLDKFKFEIIFCGEGECKPKLEKLLSHKKNIFFPGWIDFNHLLALKNLSIATLAPYRNTYDFKMSIPNKIIDSLFFGLPIITGLNGEVENLIQTYQVGYFVDNENSWSDQIKSCINDKKKRKFLSNNAKLIHKEKFTSELIYGNFVKFIEKNY